MYVCMYACMYRVVCAYVHTYMHACIHTNIHIHTYIHACIHTYIHTTYIHTYIQILAYIQILTSPCTKVCNDLAPCDLQSACRSWRPALARFKDRSSREGAFRCSREANIRALTILRIGFGVYYPTITIRNPQK